MKTSVHLENLCGSFVALLGRRRGWWGPGPELVVSPTGSVDISGWLPVVHPPKFQAKAMPLRTLTAAQGMGPWDSTTVCPLHLWDPLRSEFCS